MSEANVALVRRIWEAGDRRDAEAVLSAYDSEVEWDMSHFPLGTLSRSPVYWGHEGLRSWFREWYDAWEDARQTYDELIDAGDQVISVSTTKARGHASGAEVEMHVAAVWTIRDGKVVRVVWFPTRGDALDAVGLTG